MALKTLLPKDYGVNWNRIDCTYSKYPITKVIWTGNQFIAGNTVGTIITSPNGKNWTRQYGKDEITYDQSNHLTSFWVRGIAYNDNRIVIVGGGTDLNTHTMIQKSFGAVLTASSQQNAPKIALKNTIQVTLNNNPITFDVPTVMRDGRVLVPFRYIGEAMGAKINWEEQTQTVTLIQGVTTVKLKLGDIKAFVNDKEVNLDVPAQIINGRTFVPARFIGEALGAKVDWNKDTWTVDISKP